MSEGGKFSPGQAWFRTKSSNLGVLTKLLKKSEAVGPEADASRSKEVKAVFVVKSKLVS